MKEITKAFKTLSDETNLRVLNLLLERECCVCEIVQSLDISQSKASRHLSALHDSGFLKLRKDGLWSLYSIDKERMKDYLSDMVKIVNKALDGNEVATVDRERLKVAKRILGYGKRMRVKETTGYFCRKMQVMCIYAQ